MPLPRRFAQIIGLAAMFGEISSRQVMDALDMDQQHACQRLKRLADAGQLSREGRRGSYRYHLPKKDIA